MSAKTTAVLALIVAAVWLAPRAAAGASTPRISFTDSYTDSLVKDAAEGVENVATSGSGTITISLPSEGSGLDPATFDTNTEYSIDVGPTFNASGTLGEDPAYKAGNPSATVKATDPDTGKVLATLTFSWTATTISVSGRASTDFYSAEGYFGQPNAGAPGTTTNYDVTEVSVSLDVFDYEATNVIVTGRNKDKEVTDAYGKPASLESGSIRGAADFTPPVVTVAKPAQNTKTTSGVIPLLSGSASDNEALAGVWVVVNEDTNNLIELAGPFEPSAAPKSTSWETNDVDLSQLPDPGAFGTNVLEFYASDTSGNVSSVVTRHVFWERATNMTVQTAGPGSIRGLANNQRVNLGQGYPVTALPAKGCVLESWTDSSGDYLSGSAAFDYIAGSQDGNPNLTATFAPNPYPPFKGAYRGLFLDPVHGVTPTNAGYVTLTLTTNGAYTGKLYLGAASYPLSGQFEFPSDYAQGDTTNWTEELLKPGAGLSLDVALGLDLDTNLTDPGAGFLTGSISAEYSKSESGFHTNFWTASVMGELSQYESSTNTEPGVYNVAVPPVGSDSSQGPGGYGYGTATLTSKGAVRLVLNLADGVSPAVSFSSAVAADGSFPFFNPLYSGKGVILGWLQFTNDPVNLADLEGYNVWWAKLPAADKFYTNGFSTLATPFVSMVIGSHYAAPKAGSNILASVTNSVGSTEIPFALDDINPDGLGTEDIATNVTYNPQKNAFTVESPNDNKVKLSLAASSGTITGSFEETPPGGKVIPFRGMLLPTGAAACGFFLGTNQDTGSFILATPPTAPLPPPLLPPEGGDGRIIGGGILSGVGLDSFSLRAVPAASSGPGGK
ncbi:MAG: hypothetical protein ABSA47_12450 [Verrucomicrobiota bacterium]